MYLCRHQLTNLQVGFLVSWLQLRFRHLVLTHDPVLVVPGHFSHRLKYTLNTDMWTQYHLLWHIYLTTLTLTPLEIHSTLAHSLLVRPLWFVSDFLSHHTHQFVRCPQFVRFPSTITSWNTSVIWNTCTVYHSTLYPYEIFWHTQPCEMFVICETSQHTHSLWKVFDLCDIPAYSPLVRCLWFVQYLTMNTPCNTSKNCAISRHTHPLLYICDLWDISANSPLVIHLWFVRYLSKLTPCEMSVICEISGYTHPFVIHLWFVRYLGTLTPCYTSVICEILGYTHPLWDVCDLWDINVHSPLVRRLWFVRYQCTLTPCDTSVICEISGYTHPLWDVCDLQHSDGSFHYGPDSQTPRPRV